MATGCPYWTVDIGSFFTRKGREWFRAGDFDAGVDDMGYREYYVRMLQYGAFCLCSAAMARTLRVRFGGSAGRASFL